MTASHAAGRRRVLLAGGGLVLAALVAPGGRAAGVIEVRMSGTANGSRVWYRPRGLLVEPGQIVRWINDDAGNSHTSTAYHPANHKALRIPRGAKPWDSGFLLPKESFELRFEIPGVYDYFCLPHEAAGMVGRIIVGRVDPAMKPYADTDAQLPAAAVAQFPTVAAILEGRRVD